MEENFSPADYVVLSQHLIDLQTVASQFYFIQNGIPAIKLVRPAILNDGIVLLTEQQVNDFAVFFDTKKDNFKILKFVPASGAASRMFKFLTEFLQKFKFGNQTIDEYITQNNDHQLALFCASLTKFPFYNAVSEVIIKEQPDFKNFDTDTQNYIFIKTMLSANHFDFANQPKGILPFHVYQQQIVTAVEEHVKECIDYAVSNNRAFLHLTLAEAHRAKFESIISKYKSDVNKPVDIEVSYSYQCNTTDVLAYDLNCKPFRDSANNLVFRPGGHGALLSNLNQCNADIIFIKNVDNVLIDQSTLVSRYKKALAGLLIQYQTTIFNYINELHDPVISTAKLIEITAFIQTKLFFDAATITAAQDVAQTKLALLHALNRPIRICGMVKNQGEAGGGPFWVADRDGQVSLQIIEASQIDTSNTNNIKILTEATHFNPVDIVCSAKDYKGNKFNLPDFVDHSTGFIVQKTKNGLPYQAFELPGLWNGAMAHWITIFVEVPIATFSPVKTVNDLLKPEHQVSK